MQQRHFWCGTLALLLVISSLLLIISGQPALAHAAMLFGPSTPTPDASTTLEMAKQEETNIQTILSIINVLVVAYPLFFIVAGAVLGVFGFRGFQSLKKQGRDLLDDIRRLQQEAEEKKAAIGRTQTALVYLALGDRLSTQKDTRKAIEAYKKAGALLPEDPQINYVLGRIYSGFGYYDEAIGALEAALAAEANYPEAEMELGLAYRRRGEYQKGANAEEMRNRDYEEAIAHLQRAIELRPNYDDALSTLGGLYRRKRDYEKALDYYERASRTDPSSSYALGNVASLAWYLGKLDKARKYFTLTELAAMDRTMATHSEVYWDYYDLALAQLALGKTEDAMKSYQKAITDTPGVVHFDSALNVLYFLQKVKDPIAGLNEVIQMIEKEKSTRISLV